MSNTQGLFSTTLANPSGYPGQSFFGGNNIAIFVNSGTFIVPPDVYRIRVRVWGAGGSGGRSDSAANQVGRVATGGGGGGHGIKVINTTPATSYTVTVGTGGTAVSANGNGNAGGSSSFDTLVTCTGGGAGIGVTPVIAPGNASGGAGGTSTGGDVNYSGGRGGNITTSAILYNPGTNLACASGGGASGSIFGNGFNGGDINSTISLSTTSACTGGGGVGGRGGNITNANTEANTAGGGTAGNAQDIAVGAPNNTGTLAPGFANYFVYNGRTLVTNDGIYYSTNGAFPVEFRNSIFFGISQATSPALRYGQFPENAVNRFPGDILISASPANNIGVLLSSAGCGATSDTSSPVQYAGAFGGGGGFAKNSIGLNASSGTIGGGGGGVSTNTGSTLSGAGGNGMVIVEW